MQMKALSQFPSINPGYDAVFQSGRLSLGLVAPLAGYAQAPVPELHHHLDRIKLADELGFKSIWLRDVPFNVPSFGDAGQVFDPLVYLGLLAGQTNRIALGVASMILPLRHPAHVAKAAASADVLTGGRLILGVASGDRPAEYPALNQPFDDRSAMFRQSFEYIKRMSDTAPSFNNAWGKPGGGMDMLPKPQAGRLPLMITGGSSQTPEWVSQNGDGWMLYPRHANIQTQIIDNLRSMATAANTPDRPVMEPLHIDLTADPDALPRPIHLGYRLGMNPLRSYLKSREAIGVNHIALNLRFNQADMEKTLRALAKDLLPDFP